MMQDLQMVENFGYSAHWIVYLLILAKEARHTFVDV